MFGMFGVYYFARENKPARFRGQVNLMCTALLLLEEAIATGGRLTSALSIGKSIIAAASKVATATVVCIAYLALFLCEKMPSPQADARQPPCLSGTLVLYWQVLEQLLSFNLVRFGSHDSV